MGLDRKREAVAQLSCDVLVVPECNGAPALLPAIWTAANSEARWPSYAAQVTAAIDAWEAELRDGRVILAGDTTCSAQGPSSAPHRENLRRLDEFGVRSSYHVHHGLEHGAETEMTSTTVGSMAGWVESGLSDHAPVVVQIESVHPAANRPEAARWQK